MSPNDFIHISFRTFWFWLSDGDPSGEQYPPIVPSTSFQFLFIFLPGWFLPEKILCFWWIIWRIGYYCTVITFSWKATTICVGYKNSKQKSFDIDLKNTKCRLDRSPQQAHVFCSVEIYKSITSYCHTIDLFLLILDIVSHFFSILYLFKRYYKYFTRQRNSIYGTATE